MEFAATARAKTAYDSSFRLVGMQSGLPYLNTVGPWDYIEIHDNNPDLSAMITKYDTVLAGGTVNGVTRVNVPTINFIDPELGSAGAHGGDQANFPGQTVGDDNSFGEADASRCVSIPVRLALIHF